MAIELLPQSVADAIAAGEVIERPASVVKELLENAVDAGARRIDVVIDGAGTTRIGVSDDGCGIAADELSLAVARHATSKIRRAADLEAVATLGFRGEALASIAAVADVSVTSRSHRADHASVLRVRHGQTVSQTAIAGPAGTRVEVLDLFAATPARLRFLRSERAETAAAISVVSELVLAHPELSVSCVVDGRSRLRTGGGSLDDALTCVFGADGAELLAVAATGGITVGGAISEPRRHRASRGGLVLLANGRRIHNRALLAAVDDAYRGLIPSGRHAYGVVSVGVAPAEVDVNVHPTKREVRFRDERAVFAAVQRACWQALRDAAVYTTGSLGVLEVADAPARGGDDVHARVALDATAASIASVAAPEAAGAGTEAAQGMKRRTLEALGHLTALGQQEGRWLLASSPAGVVIVDPHAAHEKVLYAGLLEGWAAGARLQQLLLIPELVDGDATMLERYATHQDVLAACGFAVELFGPATLRCTAVPAGTSRADPTRLLRDLLETLAGGPVSEQRHRAAALIACHAAVRFGDTLGSDEQQHLLDRLVATSGGLTCPHGRPALTIVDEATLRRIFRRPAV